MKHLFFDLDHTLWDFEKNSEVALNQLYEQYKLGDHIRSFRTFLTTYRKINGHLWNEYSSGKITKEQLRINRFIETLYEFNIRDKQLASDLCEGYITSSPYQTNLFPGTIETLENLKNEGFELHIITNGFKEIQHIKLGKSKIDHFFDLVLCSEEVGKAKPAKEVFTTALERTKAKANESLMIGDNYKADILGAARAQISGILFDPHRYYKENTHDWQIQELSEIPELLPWIQKSKL